MSAGSERLRFSSRRKTAVVLRLLRGEELDFLSRELGVTAGMLSQLARPLSGRGSGSR